MAHKLGLRNEVSELKLGKSFTHSGSNGFHTVRCKLILLLLISVDTVVFKLRIFKMPHEHFL